MHYYVQAGTNEARHLFGRIVLLHEINVRAVMPIVPGMTLKHNSILEVPHIGKAHM
jgi:hypothetical protein